MVEIIEFTPPPPVPEPEPARPDPSSISPDAWRRFESAALSVVQKIQPTVSSDHLRTAVIDYIQRLFRFHAGCQVFPFGSVPLKTYLPDGDIDLTAFGPASSDENLAHEIHTILLSEEQKKNTEFEVKDVQLINAEVKLVKCLVQNIAMDISFNQIGGLCTLCFLEKVDKNFGKNHLFKRSIILIKDWCYYESRILGAHHGLISTYALETLVLYIFHIFHKSLDGPLAVLYRFLDYYSKFDWDNKGISLFGPVSLASLPELVTDPPGTHDADFLQREEFLKECVEAFSVPPKSSEKNTRAFSQKFLNIVDPLKRNNNLGRSVSKGNFYRIRSAFDFGARKLGKILQLPKCSTVSEVNQFFKNTLNRNCTGSRPDVLVSSPSGGLRTDHFASDSVSGDLDVERVSQDSSPLCSNSNGDLSDQFNNINISDSNYHGLVKQNEHTRGLLDSDATSYVSTDSPSMKNGGGFCEASTATGTCALPSERHHYAPHTFYHPGNSKKFDGSNGTNLSNHEMPSNRVSGRSHHSFEDAKHSNGFSGSSPPFFGHHAYSSVDSVDGLAKYNSVYGSKNSQPGSTTSDIVSDLSGDFDTNFKNLLYAQGCQQDNSTNQVYYQMMPPPAQYWNTRPALGLGPPYSPHYFVLRPFHQTDDHTAMRTHGTGTYFPDPNRHRDRPSAGRGGRGRNHFPPNNYQKFHHYVRTDMIPLEESRHEPPLQIHVPGANDHRIPSPMDIPLQSPSSQSPRDPKLPTLSPSSPVQRDFHGNGFMVPQDSKLEFGTLGALPLEAPSKEHASRSDFASNNQASGPVSPISSAKKAGTGYNRRKNPQPYRLKDSGDFPPLSGC
ncbi:hypothetical protein QOZ80_5BG0426170 [Eleusine coracana subsp. coracana]|nr:hypothetical protein QOZ80_5BG0426170 [Eleusine coracana subsp. coracana]